MTEKESSPNKFPYAQLSDNARISLLYHNMGWHPIPLHPKSKKPLFKGTTGRNGKNISRNTLSKLKNDTRDGRIGIGLRLAEDVIGIDIDAYKDGGKGLASIYQKVSTLPKTFRVTARGLHSRSAMMLYRIPLDFDLSRAGRKLERYSIDIVHHRYRSVTVSPTMHPTILQEYKWYHPEDYELACSKDTFEVPYPYELPELPLSWLMFLNPKYDAFAWLSEAAVLYLSYPSSSSPIINDNYPMSPLVSSLPPEGELAVPKHGAGTYLSYPSSSSPIINDNYPMSPCTCNYPDIGIYQQIYNISHTSTARNNDLNVLARDGYWCVLRKEITEPELDEILEMTYVCNGYIKEHGKDDFLRTVASGKKFAEDNFVNIPRNYNAARIQTLVEKVESSTASPKSKESFYVLALRAKNLGASYAVSPTRGVGIAVGVGRTSISKYMHNWEQRGWGVLKVGPASGYKPSNEFHFYLDNGVTEMPKHVKVNLDDYAEHLSRFIEYISTQGNPSRD